MWRLLHVFAIAALIGSAAYVYSVKYQTIYASEQIVKTRHQIARERDAINLLRAEFAHLTRPDRRRGAPGSSRALADLRAGCFRLVSTRAPAASASSPWRWRSPMSALA